MQRQAERERAVLMVLLRWCFDAFGVFVERRKAEEQKRGNRAIWGFCLFLACIKTSCLSDCVLLQKEAGNANLDILTWVSRCGIDKCQL